MQSFPAYFTWRDGEPIICIIGAVFVEAVNRAYEEDGEVELFEPVAEEAVEVPSGVLPDQIILVGPGGLPSHGAGTGRPMESFCWYAKPEIHKAWVTKAGPCVGDYALYKVQLRASNETKPRTWWGYFNGIGGHSSQMSPE